MLASEVITDGWVSRGINDGEGERVELLIESMVKKNVVNGMPKEKLKR